MCASVYVFKEVYRMEHLTIHYTMVQIIQSQLTAHLIYMFSKIMYIADDITECDTIFTVDNIVQL